MRLVNTFYNLELEIKRKSDINSFMMKILKSTESFLKTYGINIKDDNGNFILSDNTKGTENTQK